MTRVGDNPQGGHSPDKSLAVVSIADIPLRLILITVHLAIASCIFHNPQNTMLDHDLLQKLAVRPSSTKSTLERAATGEPFFLFSDTGMSSSSPSLLLALCLPLRIGISNHCKRTDSRSLGALSPAYP